MVALVAVPLHRYGVAVGGAVVPWGLVLALAAAAACGLALREQKAATLGFGLGWIALLLGLMPGGPGGDYVFMNDLRGWGLLGGGVLVGVVLVGVGLAGARETP